MDIKPTILVCGKTGAGKTSLIQAITHKGTVPDSAISDSEPCTKDFKVYETDVANYIDAEGFEPSPTKTINDYAKFIWNEMYKRLEQCDPDKIITSIWYCIDATGARVQKGDVDFIKMIKFHRVKVIVTKSELLRQNQRKEFDDALRKLAKPENIIYVSSHRSDGLQNLIGSVQTDALAAGMFAMTQVVEWKKRWEQYYRELRRAWEERIDNEADSIVRWGAGRAAAIAIVPVPLADIAPLIANETYMIDRLGSLYGYSIGGNILSTLTGVAGGSLAGKVLASFFPGLKIAIAAGVTYGVGKAAKAYFRSGMKLNEEELKREYEKAKDKAKDTDWKQHQVKDEDEPQESVNSEMVPMNNESMNSMNNELRNPEISAEMVQKIFDNYVWKWRDSILIELTMLNGFYVVKTIESNRSNIGMLSGIMPPPKIDPKKYLRELSVRSSETYYFPIAKLTNKQISLLEKLAALARDMINHAEDGYPMKWEVENAIVQRSITEIHEYLKTKDV